MRPVLILLFFLPVIQLSHAASTFGLVQIGVADLRASSGTLPQNLEYDPLQETQLLYNEPVLVLEKTKGWLRVEALEQKEFTHENRWQGYPGWIRKDAVKFVKRVLPANLVVKTKIARLYDRPAEEGRAMALSLGTKLQSRGKEQNGFWKIETPRGKTAWVRKEDVRLLVLPPEEFARKLILESGIRLLGDPYYWGGRSALMEGIVSAVDCSGFTNLAYRVAGMDIPRDSHEQFMMAKKIKKEELKPGDLIFSASKEKPGKVTHVAIFIDSTTILEAPKTGEVVRKIEFDKKYGPDSVLHFGTYFGKDQER